MRILLLLLSCLIIISCSDKKEEKSALTTTSDNITYKNTYFGLEIQKPEGWYAQDPAATLKMSQKGANLMTGNDQNMKAIVEESLKSSVPIFAFFRWEPGTPSQTNPNVLSVAENISILPGIKTGCDYLFHARKLLENAALKMTISEGCQTTSIGEAHLGYFDLSMNIRGVGVLQKYYACVQGDHAISIIQTYFDDDSKAKVDNILNSLKLKCS